MWLDDCVHYEVAKAMVIRDIMNEREAEVNEIDAEDLEAAADYFDNLKSC